MHRAGEGYSADPIFGYHLLVNYTRTVIDPRSGRPVQEKQLYFREAWRADFYDKPAVRNTPARFLATTEEERLVNFARLRDRVAGASDQ